MENNGFLESLPSLEDVSKYKDLERTYPFLLADKLKKSVYEKYKGIVYISDFIVNNPIETGYVFLKLELKFDKWKSFNLSFSFIDLCFDTNRIYPVTVKPFNDTEYQWTYEHANTQEELDSIIKKVLQSEDCSKLILANI